MGDVARFTPPRDDCPVCPPDGMCDLACVMGAVAHPEALHAQALPAEGQE